MARKTYSEEFRRQAVELYESTPGATFRGIAADLGITRNTLKDWVTSRGRASPASTNSTTSTPTSSSRAAAAGGLPGVERGTLHVQQRAQPLHAPARTGGGGGGVVGDEREAAHQFVSPAKYLAAARRISRSVTSVVLSARNAAFSAFRRASRCSVVSERVSELDRGSAWRLGMWVSSW